MSIFVVVYEYGDGPEVTAFASLEKANKHVADIAREWWDERADESASDDHSGLSDDAAIGAYFDGHESRFYSIQECVVESQDAEADLLEVLERAVEAATADQYEQCWYADARAAIEKAKG